MIDQYLGRTNELNESVRTQLGLVDVNELSIDGIESHYKYRIENAGENRLVIVIVDARSNAYMNEKFLKQVLEEREGTRSIVGFSNANSGQETVRVVRSKDNASPDPRVYIATAKQPSSPRRVVEIDDLSMI